MANGALRMALLSFVLAAAGAHAEGLAPPQPYNYLHPPAALARNNHPPKSGSRAVPMRNGRSTQSVVLFTGDGQAGLGAHPGAFGSGARVTSVQLTITPVNTAGRLPSGYTADGNAYRFAALGMPGRQPVQVLKQLGMVLRWPRTPFAIYQYSGGRWTRLCDSQTWQIQVGLVLCNIHSLGIFLQVHHPTNVKPK